MAGPGFGFGRCFGAPSLDLSDAERTAWPSPGIGFACWLKFGSQNFRFHPNCTNFQGRIITGDDDLVIREVELGAPAQQSSTTNITVAGTYIFTRFVKKTQMTQGLVSVWTFTFHEEAYSLFLTFWNLLSSPYHGV